MRYGLRALLLLLLLPLGLAPIPTARRAQAADEYCFDATGQCIAGRFRDYWKQNGGLPVFGFPISGELWEDGRVVQYFERNRFEAHPENPSPNDVLLGRLGEEFLGASGRDWHTLPQSQPVPGCSFFDTTSRNLCADFLAYWEQNGGLLHFGYPLTEPFAEVSQTDGQIYTVQYFERARLELHPENPPPAHVLVALLGSWRAGWLLDAALGQPAAAVRAAITGPADAQAPFATVALSITAGGYSGPAELRVFDGAGRPEARMAISVSDGAASVALTAGGALGPHPAILLIGGQLAGITSAAYLLDTRTSIVTGQPRYDDLVARLRTMISQDARDYVIDAYRLHGYRSPDSDLLWLRDHVYQALGYRYFERDMTSLLDYFRRAQRPDGSFDDYVANPAWGMISGRVQVEADLEYLFVQGVYQAWQATGDQSWLRANQPAMERGLAYSTSDPQRWEPALGLVKRPFTIDTWDFEYGGPTLSPDGKTAPRQWIDQDTKWSIMHGDNTGLAYAMILMSRVADQLGDPARAAGWRDRAAALMRRLNTLSWNGNFFTHQVHLTPVTVPGVDERQQLSLSNAYALNRAVLAPQQADAIIGEYERRYQNRGTIFAEWFSIDPPFPSGSLGTSPGWGAQPGEYVNGGIMPLVGGELARGAFSWGHERYGFNILDRYYQLIVSQGGSYLWYHPTGEPGRSSADSLATDGWGSAEMLAALIEGAAGVVDQAALFKQVAITPRWAADPAVQTATVTARYDASFGYVAYRWERRPHAIELRVTGSLEQGQGSILLPDEARTISDVSVGGVPVSYRVTTLGESRYVELAIPSATVPILISWR